MADDFEEHLREALAREAANLPVQIEATTVHERVQQRRRFPAWLIPVAAPIATAVIIGAVILNAFPGPAEVMEPSVAEPSLTVTHAPLVTPAPTIPPAPAARVGPAIAVGDGELYVVGGTRRQPLISAYVFDAADGVWSRLPDLADPRVGAAGAVLDDGRVLVVGGRRDREALRSTLVLEPGGDSWQEGAPLPFGQSHAAIVAFEDRVLLIGGSEPEHEDAVLEYQPDDDAWRELAPMPVGTSQSAAVSLDGFVYVVGGAGEDGEPSAAVYRYDPVADSWATLSPMPVPGVVGAAALDGKVWVFGDARQALVYDPPADAWHRAGRIARPGMSWYAPIVLPGGSILVVSGSSGAAGAGADLISPRVLPDD